MNLADNTPTPAAPTPRLRAMPLAAWTVFAVALLLYVFDLGTDFTFDSRSQILVDDYVHAPRHVWDILSLRVLGMDVLDRNRPLVLLSFMADSAVWGRLAMGYHLTSALLHAGCAVLVFLLAVGLLADEGTGRPRWMPSGAGTLAAFLPALWFAVHPVQVEAVAQVSFREDLLALFFLLAGLLVARRFPGVTGWRAWGLGAAGVGLFLLAVGSKETGVAGPPVLAVYGLLFRRGTGRRLHWGVLIAAATAAVVAFLVISRSAAPETSRILLSAPSYPGGSLASALRLQPRILALYLQNIAVPTRLCADYGGASIRHIPLWLAVGGLVFVAVAAVAVVWHSRVFAVGLCLVVCGLLPVSNLVPIYMAAADRFLYMPMAGLAVCLAALLSRGFAVGRRRVLVAAAAVVGLCLLTPLAVIARQRHRVWDSELALWLDTVERNPFSTMGYGNLGYALYALDRPAEAVYNWRRAVHLSRAGHADSLAGLALGLWAVGRREEAVDCWHRAVALDARYAEPERLVESLSWEPWLAARLQAIVRAAGRPALTP